MTAPSLTRKLVLEDRQRVADGAGGYVETWVALGALWGELKAGTGRERELQHLVLSSVPYKITVRAAPPGALARPKPDQRLVDGNRIFLILAVADADKDARYLTCFTREEEASQ